MTPEPAPGGGIPTGQPGYDALADLYDRTFPGPWQRPLDRHVVDAFADGLPRGGTIIDLGCGTGHVTVELDVEEFPHVVAPAWRWNPSSLARALDEAGFGETWRVIVCPDGDHPYPECHLCAVRA